MTQITSVPFHGTNILTDEDGTHVRLTLLCQSSPRSLTQPHRSGQPLLPIRSTICDLRVT